MPTNKIPANWKNCATCAHWCGNQHPDKLCVMVEYDVNERARCAGGGFNNTQTTGLQTCREWKQRFRK